MKRHDGRRADQLRCLKLKYDIFEYAPGSVLFEIGKTKVLCAVSLQNNVPQFLRGKDKGWLTAEYALLPAATLVRTVRETSQMKRQGRSVEISRLISRVLRVAVDTTVLGERTIVVDCDVLQADGGTRTACITGSYFALCMAQAVWLKNGIISQPFLKEEIAAVSVGIKNGTPILDLDYKEDSSGDADINLIMTRSGDIIEIQGGSEQKAIPWDLFTQIGELGRSGIDQLFDFFIQNQVKNIDDKCNMHNTNAGRKSPIFSLQNRQKS